MRKFIKRILPLAIIYTVIFIIFFHGLGNYFLQDDFFNIYRGWIGSFAPYPYFAFRPIPYEIFGSFVFTVLGMNPVSTHLILLLIHFLNVYLLWKLIDKFTKDKWIQFFIAFLYGVSSIHFGVLYWMTADYLLLGTTFLLFFLHTLLAYKLNPTRKRFLLLIFLYLCMLFTNEIFSIFPVFLFFLSTFETRIKTFLVPMTLLSGLSLAFRINFKAYSAGPDYAIGTIGEIARTIWWYVLRSLNVAEGIRLMEKGQIYLPLLFFLILVLGIVVVFLIFYKTKEKPNRKILLLGVTWFILFGIPYFVLVYHATAYYLNTALIGFIVAVTYIWLPVLVQNKKRYKFLILLFLSAYSLLSYLNVQFLQRTNWIVWRGEIARKYVQLAKRLYPTLPKGATLVFKKTSVTHKEISLALYNDIAFKLIYADPTLHVVYDESHILLPNEYSISDGDSS